MFFFCSYPGLKTRVRKKEKLPKAFTSPTNILLKRKIPTNLLPINLDLLPGCVSSHGEPVT